MAMHQILYEQLEGVFVCQIRHWLWENFTVFSSGCALGFK